MASHVLPALSVATGTAGRTRALPTLRFEPLPAWCVGFTARDAADQSVGYLMYVARPELQAARIDDVRVELPTERRKGISTALFAQLLAVEPGLKHIEGSLSHLNYQCLVERRFAGASLREAIADTPFVRAWRKLGFTLKHVDCFCTDEQRPVYPTVIARVSREAATGSPPALPGVITPRSLAPPSLTASSSTRAWTGTTLSASPPRWCETGSLPARRCLCTRAFRSDFVDPTAIPPSLR